MCFNYPAGASRLLKGVKKAFKDTLPLHETDAVEENAVENKEAHVGVLEGGFLERQEVMSSDKEIL